MQFVVIALVCAALAVVLFLLWKSGRLSIQTKAYSVDQARYLGNRRNASSIYGSPGRGVFYSPFNLSLEAMSRLLLVDVDDDPVYGTIELQVFDDEQGRGASVLLYHKDGRIDTYYTSGLNREVYLDRSRGQASLNDDIEYRFEVTALGLDAQLRLEDEAGRNIAFHIRENQPAKKTFDILAPAGAMIDDLAGFPFFYMKRTAFVKRAGTQIDVEIGGVKRNPVAIPVAINGTFVFLARYCTEPIVGTWNEAFTGQLDPLSPGQAGEAREGGTTYRLVHNDGHCEIASMTRVGCGHEISLAFSPPVPDLVGLKDGVTIGGRFSSGADGTTGIVAGAYRLYRSGARIELVMQPIQGWQPMPGKRWVKLYRWCAQVEADGRDRVTVKAAWTRR